MDEIARLAQRYEALKSLRSGFEPAWKSLAELFLPGRWRADSDSLGGRKPFVDGRVVNSCGILAMRSLAAGMQGGMTSPARPWFALKLKGFEDRGGAWIEEVTSRMRMLLHQSSFYNAIHGLYADLATFGTALLVETANENGLDFYLVRAGEYVLDVNGQGQVDTFFRHMRMSARQIIDLFGAKNCPDMIHSAVKNPEQGFSVIHGVLPNPGDGMPFSSIYWLHDGKPWILSRGGYRTFPAFAPRWDVSGHDVYGRSPAMDVLPDASMLQAMTRSMRLMQHRIADPPMVADSSLRQFNISLKPGGITYADLRTVNGGLAPIEQPAPQALNYTMQAIERVEKVVRDGLYADLFRMLVDDDRRQITATEIQARQQEKMILIGPVVERLHKELLEPLITRTFHLMAEYGALPPVPEDMQGLELDVTFESVLAQAQKLTATSAIDQSWAFALQTAQADPAVLDVINKDAMVADYARRCGMPLSCLNDEASVRKLRIERARANAKAEEEARMQADVASAGELSQAAKNLGQTPVGADGQTLMGTILGGLGGG